MGATRYVERNPVKARLVDRAEDWPWSSAPAHCAACDSGGASGGDMTQMQSEAESEAEHLGSCPQTAAECDWLVDRASAMNVSWPAFGGRVRAFVVGGRRGTRGDDASA